MDGTEDSEGTESSLAFSFTTTQGCPVSEPTSASAPATGPPLPQHTPALLPYVALCHLQSLQLSKSWVVRNFRIQNPAEQLCYGMINVNLLFLSMPRVFVGCLDAVTVGCKFVPLVWRSNQLVTC